MSKWTLFSNHGHVLVCLARDPEARLRDVATDVGITERAVQKIVRDLQEGGMISIKKVGRRNSYRVHKKQPLRHDLEKHCTLREIVKLVCNEPAQKRSEAPVVKKPRAIGIEALTPPEKPKPKKADPVKKPTAKSDQPDSIERQQRSLF